MTNGTDRLLTDIRRDLPRWHSAVGHSAAVWADDVTVEPAMWCAFTGTASADYNVVLCHDGPAGAAVSAGLQRVRDLGSPSLIMVAGRPLADVSILIEAGWVCVGATPFMAAAPGPSAADARVERLAPDRYEEARQLLVTAFGLDPGMALVALPDRIGVADASSLWGLRERGELVSCLAAHVRDGVLTIWSMATPPRHQRRGYARALFATVQSRLIDDGVSAVVLSASVTGAPLYAAMGFSVIEHWQIWSRRRWVLGRM